MEKIKDSISKVLPPLRLYLDEVQELYDFVASVAENVTLEAEDYRLNSPEELKNLCVSNIHNLVIGAQRPYIKVELGHFFARIYLGSGDVKAVGIASTLESILLKGRAKVYFAPSGIVAGILVGSSFSIGYTAKNVALTGICIAFAVAYFIILLIDQRFRLKRYSTVLPVRRKEAASFLARNKDQILLLIIGAVIGSGITILFKWLEKLC